MPTSPEPATLAQAAELGQRLRRTGTLYFAGSTLAGWPGIAAEG